MSSSGSDFLSEPSISEAFDFLSDDEVPPSPKCGPLDVDEAVGYWKTEVREELRYSSAFPEVGDGVTLTWEDGEGEQHWSGRLVSNSNLPLWVFLAAQVLFPGESLVVELLTEQLEGRVFLPKEETLRSFYTGENVRRYMRRRKATPFHRISKLRLKADRRFKTLEEQNKSITRCLLGSIKLTGHYSVLAYPSGLCLDKEADELPEHRFIRTEGSGQSPLQQDIVVVTIATLGSKEVVCPSKLPPEGGMELTDARDQALFYGTVRGLQALPSVSGIPGAIVATFVSDMRPGDLIELPECNKQLNLRYFNQRVVLLKGIPIGYEWPSELRMPAPSFELLGGMKVRLLLRRDIDDRVFLMDVNLTENDRPAELLVRALRMKRPARISLKKLKVDLPTPLSCDPLCLGQETSDSWLNGRRMQLEGQRVIDLMIRNGYEINYPQETSTAFNFEDFFGKVEIFDSSKFIDENKFVETSFGTEFLNFEVSQNTKFSLQDLIAMETVWDICLLDVIEGVRHRKLPKVSDPNAEDVVPGAPLRVGILYNLLGTNDELRFEHLYALANRIAEPGDGSLGKNSSNLHVYRYKGHPEAEGASREFFVAIRMLAAHRAAVHASVSHHDTSDCDQTEYTERMETLLRGLNLNQGSKYIASAINRIEYRSDRLMDALNLYLYPEEEWFVDALQVTKARIAKDETITRELTRRMFNGNV